MNFGGIHVFVGLLVFLLCTAMTVALLYGVYVLLLLLRFFFTFSLQIVQKITNYMRANNWVLSDKELAEITVEPVFHDLWQKTVFKKICYVCVTVLSVTYANQRHEWIGEDNRHYIAKEYWVSGQVIYLHRKLLGLYLHPENPLIYPYTLLQKAVYHVGVRFLPESDGERYVWMNHWFLYPYAHKLERPYFVGDHKAEPEMVELLDTCWFTMRGIASMECSDSRIQQLGELGLPGLASYYSLYLGHYTGPLLGAGKKVRKDPVLRSKLYDTLRWIDNVKSDWVESGYFDEVKNHYPSVAAIQQAAVMNILQNLSLSLVMNEEFRCNHPLIERLYEEYQDAMSDDPSKNMFLNYKKTDSKQARLFYRTAIYTTIGSSGYYILHHVCRRKFPVEKYVVETNKIFCVFSSVGYVEAVYNGELKSLILRLR